MWPFSGRGTNVGGGVLGSRPLFAPPTRRLFITSLIPLPAAQQQPLAPRLFRWCTDDLDVVQRYSARLGYFLLFLLIGWRIAFSSSTTQVHHQTAAVVVAGATENWPPLRTDTASLFSPQLIPITLGGFEDAWTVAPSILPLSAAKGVALLLHGCGHSAEVWATAGGGERELVSALIRQRLLPIAITSVDARDALRETKNKREFLGVFGRGCWELGDDDVTDADRWGADGEQMQRIFRHFTKYWIAARGQATTPPLVVIGVSSGGFFASQVPFFLPVAATAIYIAHLAPGVLHSLATKYTTYASPVIFIHMPLDEITAATIVKDAATLTDCKVSGVIIKQVKPSTLSRISFSTHFSSSSLVSQTAAAAAAVSNSLISQTASTKLWELLRDNEILSKGDSGGGNNDEGNSLWVKIEARSDLVRLTLNNFLNDARLTWKTGVSPGSFEWDSDSSSQGNGGGASGGGGGHSAAHAVENEARRVLLRGLQETLNEAEAGHEMTSTFALEVAALLVGALDDV